MTKRNVIASVLLVFVVGLDIATKYLAHAAIAPGSPLQLLPFLDLVNVRNMGAAFGMFNTLGNGIFIGVSLVAIVLLFWLFVRGDMNFIALTLIMAGAIGNLYDRVTLGYVRDFIDVHAGSFHWPAFNVADSSLTIGIILLFIMPFFEKSEEGKEHTEEVKEGNTSES
jgi:signal peptidase II